MLELNNSSLTATSKAAMLLLVLRLGLSNVYVVAAWLLSLSREVVRRYSRLEQHLKTVQTIRSILAKSPVRAVEAVGEPQIHALSRRFSNSTLDKMVAAYEAGESSTAIAERQIGKVSPAEAERIVELYLAGQTQRAVADQFGITRTAVMHILRKQGVSLRKRTPGC